MENVLTRTESGIYGLVGASGEVVLASASGRVYSDSSTGSWNALAAIANGDDSGFQVLLQGTGIRENTYYLLSTNAKGVIEFGSGWKTIDQALGLDWGSLFPDDLLDSRNAQRSLEQVVESTWSWLGHRAGESDFSDILDRSFSGVILDDSWDEGVESIQDLLISKSGLDALQFELVESSLLQDQRLIAAYTDSHPSGLPTILIDQSWFQSASQEHLLRGFRQEIGHAIDHVLNGIQPEFDSEKDEGAYFATQLLSDSPDSVDPKLFDYNDHYQLLIEGQQVFVEASALNNQPPFAYDSTLTVGQGKTHEFSLQDFGFSDPDTINAISSGMGSTLQKIKINSLPLTGSLWLESKDGNDQSQIEVVVGQEIIAPDIAKLRFTAGGDSQESVNFDWSAHDGYVYSVDQATIVVNISPLVDQKPILDASGYRSASLRSSPGTAVNTKTLIDGGLILRDDDSILTSLREYDSIDEVIVSIQGQTSGSFVVGDHLEVDVPTSVSSSYDAATGLLHLAGSLSATEYQDILRTLSFTTSNASDDQQRSISLIVKSHHADQENVARFDGIDDSIETPEVQFPHKEVGQFQFGSS